MEFYLEPFCGSAVILLNKERCRYECINDFNSELINYFLVIRKYPEEFETFKGKNSIFSLCSKELFERIIKGEIKPKNDIERAYLFFYVNKLSYASIETNKTFGGVIGPLEVDYKSNFGGINPKTTRPFTNNDRGLLTPLDPRAIERLQYVNIMNYDFRHVYKLFYRGFYEKKGLTNRCFVYFDPPYPSKEKYYVGSFSDEDHLDLLEILINCPFYWMLSIGGDCRLYLDALDMFFITEVKTKYQTDANSQDEITEYVITNYDPSEIGKSIPASKPIEQKSLSSFLEVV